MPSLLLAIAIAAGIIFCLARWFEWSQIFNPQKKMEGDPSLAGLAFEDVTFYAEDGCRLSGWWVPRDDARGAVVYCHGNAGNISGRIDVIKGLHDLGLQVFIFDYRGYGQSSGLPHEKGIYRDARAAYEVVRARYEDAEQPPVMIYGASLGGPVAVNLATEKPCRALVLEGSFTSAIAVGERWFPMLPIRLIASQHFDALTKIRALNIPLLVAHSPHDQVIPFDMGNELFTAAPGPKRFVSLNGEHGEAGWQETPHFYTELKQLVDKVFPR